MLAYDILKFELELTYFPRPLTTKNSEHHLVQVLYAEQASNLVWATCEHTVVAITVYFTLDTVVAKGD